MVKGQKLLAGNHVSPFERIKQTSEELADCADIEQEITWNFRRATKITIRKSASVARL